MKFFDIKKNNEFIYFNALTGRSAPNQEKKWSYACGHEMPDQHTWGYNCVFLFQIRSLVVASIGGQHVMLCAAKSLILN